MLPQYWKMSTRRSGTVPRKTNRTSPELVDDYGTTWLTSTTYIKLLSDTNKRKPYPLARTEQGGLFSFLPWSCMHHIFSSAQHSRCLCGCVNPYDSRIIISTFDFSDNPMYISHPNIPIITDRYWTTMIQYYVNMTSTIKHMSNISRERHFCQNQKNNATRCRCGYGCLGWGILGG